MPRILISAGEASGDLYAAGLVRALREQIPDVEFFGCAGARMRAAGVRSIVDAASLSVVGLVEVLGHLPRIYGEYRKLISVAQRERPDVAILTDSPDFHLRVAQRLKKAGIPVVYLVAPQVWAWRRGRIRALRRNLDRLLCIFPFEEDFFLRAGVPAEYIGHPLARLVQPTLSREDFFRKHRIPGDRAMVAMLPGSRRGEVVRHLGALIEAAERINARHAATFLLASPPAFSERHGTWLKEAVGNAPVRLVEGETWNALAHADVALAASGTVTIEAALLGTPMVTFYRVTGVSWLAGRFLLDVPFYSMVNLIAGRKVVPELMQNEVRGERLAEEALRLLVDGSARAAMRRELTSVAARLQSEEDPLRKAARIAGEYLRK